MENELYQPTKRDLWDFFYDGGDSYGYSGENIGGGGGLASCDEE